MKPIHNLKSQWNGADRPQRMGTLIVLGVALFFILIAVVKTIGFAHEGRQRRDQMAAGPRVLVSSATWSAGERTLTLLGEARPFESATLYAKVSGYLKDVHVDKGDSVRAGQLLAVIEAPETNRDYDAAAADARNKRGIADRLKPLLERQLISQQEADQAFADADVAQSHLQSLGAVKGYQELRAPFSGVITARFADPGALVQNAANSQTSALPVFTIAKVNRLRIYVYVDQRDAAAIHNGLPVQVSVPERPDIKVAASITRFSGALDERTRMLLAEIDIDNEKNTVVAGSYVQVSFKVQAPRYLEIPVEGLVLRQAKEVVPVVTSSHTVTYKPVVLADNDGQHVRVIDGLQEGDWVALNLGNSADEGSAVQPITPSTGTAPSSK